MTRMAISPRLAMRIFLNIRPQKVRQGTTGRAGKSRGSRQQGGRNVWEFSGPVGLLGLDQHDVLRAAGGGDHVHSAQAGLRCRHRRLNGRLIHVVEGDLGAVRHATEGDAVETLLRAEVFPLIVILSPGFMGSGSTFVILGRALMSQTGALSTESPGPPTDGTS